MKLCSARFMCIGSNSHRRLQYIFNNFVLLYVWLSSYCFCYQIYCCAMPWSVGLPWCSVTCLIYFTLLTYLCCNLIILCCYMYDFLLSSYCFCNYQINCCVMPWSVGVPWCSVTCWIYFTLLTYLFCNLQNSTSTVGGLSTLTAETLR
jgi:hypothetical protein